jgi:hypothetical protein
MRPPPPVGTLAAMNPQSSRARVTAVIAAGGLALLTAACSGSSSSTGPGAEPNAGGASGSAAAIAYVQCVHSHGVPGYPEPDSRGDIPKVTSGQQVGVSDAQLAAASKACEALWPYKAPTQAQQEQELVQDLKFARCMRSSGLPNFPDPTTDPRTGRVEFVLSVSRLGANPRSPLILSKAHACLHVLPPGASLPSATEAP